jgi:signal transduction histidine kinase
MNPPLFDAGAGAPPPRLPQGLPPLSPHARECIAAAQRMSWIDNEGLVRLAQSLDRLAEDTGSDYLLAWARGVHAYICTRCDRPHDALERADQMAQTAAAYPADTDLIQLELRCRAQALDRLGRCAEMMMVQLQLLSLARRSGDVVGEIGRMIAIGAALLQLGQSDQAVTTWEQADELRADIPIDRTIDQQRLETYRATLHNNLASAYLDRAESCRSRDGGAAAVQHLAQAAGQARLARRHVRHAAMAYMLAAVWDTSAECFLLQGRLRRARSAIRVAQHQARLAESQSVSLIQVTAARIEIAAGQPERALQLLSASLNLPDDAPASLVVIRGLQTLIRAHEDCGHWEQAYRAQTRLMAMQQALTSQYAQQRHVLVQRQLAGERDDAMRYLGHDLRAPLSSIISGIDLLPEPQDPALRHTLQQVRHSAERALRISAGVLGHLQSAQLDEKTFVPVNLPALVDDVCAEIEPVARSKSVRIVLRIDPLADRRNAHAAGSHEFLQRALINVIDNALRHAPPGSDVNVALRPGGRYWRITIADRGPGFGGAAGMSSVAPGLGVVLDARAPATASVHGLGLRLVHEVMERHHGIVRIGRNEPGGALVELLLPVMTGET